MLGTQYLVCSEIDSAWCPSDSQGSGFRRNKNALFCYGKAAVHGKLSIGTGSIASAGLKPNILE
jgi:hypothetical protein